MKKKIIISCGVVLIAIIVMIAVVSIFSTHRYLRIGDGIDKIAVVNGNNGNMIEITDREGISKILTEIESLQLKRNSKLPPGTGWEISIKLYSSNTVDTFTIRGTGIEYNGYFYGENPDTKNLLDFLKTLL